MSVRLVLSLSRYVDVLDYSVRQKDYIHNVFCYAFVSIIHNIIEALNNNDFLSYRRHVRDPTSRNHVRLKNKPIRPRELG